MSPALIPLVIRETMTQIEAKLPAERFVRVHRSIIVNTERVREVQPWFKGDYVLIMHDGTKLRSGRLYRAVVQALIRWLRALRIEAFDAR